jgi:hypothetical protein
MHYIFSHSISKTKIEQVVVVDQSGSMRKTDLSGGATRSDAVWLTLAVDLVANKLAAGESKSSDVVSVVSMRDNRPLAHGLGTIQRAHTLASHFRTNK